MGVFDFFKRKKTNTAEDSGPSADYVLAHYALRQIALESPLQMLGLLASPDAKKFLTELLQDVEKQLGQKATYRADQIQIHCVRLGEYPCAIVEFPAPQKMAEAYMIALVALLSADEDVPEDLSTVSARYFTLEKGFSIDGGDRTVLCEWDTTSHKNYGDGPNPTPATFAKELEAIIR